MAALEIRQFNCLSDNFGVLIHDPDTGMTASIDAPEEGPITAALAEAGWTLSHIFVTHHHFDHTGAVAALKATWNCTVIGPRDEAEKIEKLDATYGDGDSFDFGSTSVSVISTPGHTLGQVAYWIESDAVAFTGDTLFALGCGRVFEGTPAQMWASLDKLRQLPPQTRIYCGHEYTQANADFAITVDPDNADLKARHGLIAVLRAQGKPTLPTTIAAELNTNPFLRPDDPGVQAAVGKVGAPLAEVFAEVRARKDNA